MSTPEPVICWLDLETTGLDWASALILEVGAIITGRDLEPIAEYEALIRPVTNEWEAMMDPVVYEMHERSGLLAALAKQERPDRFFQPGRSVTMVGDELLHFVGQYEPEPGLAYLGGSGVSHFDRVGMARWWPKLERHFHRRTVDVGVVRQYLNLFTPGGAPPNRASTRPHRALADLHTILDEARTYRTAMRMGVG